ncbi:hypothetical protein [Bacillus sp. FSL K6-3431]|uniref:hypothetical protein n=1 Tax=Bacillus sp. FSL K6-3431 TaxID=2921500 RepID=UPI0030F990EE
MNIPTELRKLREGLYVRLAENEADVKRYGSRLTELAVERDKLRKGIEGIMEELSKIEGERLDDGATKD